jgi:heme/copper-type cytochrome/quinol oxidase subunit 1
MKQIVIRFVVLGAGAVVMFIGGLLLAFRPGSGVAVPQGFSTYAPLVSTSYSSASSAVFIIGLVLLVLGFAAVVGWIGFEIGRTLRADAVGPAAATRRKS